MSNENVPPTPIGGEDDVPRNSKGEPLWPRPPRKPLTGWVLLLPIILLVGVIWLNSNGRPGEGTTTLVENTASDNTPPPVKNTVPREKPKSSKPSNLTPASEQVVLYVPNDQAELTRQKVPLSTLIGAGLGGVPANYLEVVGRAALEYIFKKNPDYFPAGITVNSLKKEGDLITIDLPADFATSPLWNKGDSYGIVATGSIVNTLASIEGNGKLAPVKVKFLSGGKPFEVLGELDMSEPYKPNPTLVTSP